MTQLIDQGKQDKSVSTLKEELKATREHAQELEQRLDSVTGPFETRHYEAVDDSTQSRGKTVAASLDSSEKYGDSGVEELRKDSMMAHLLDSLDAHKDIGHYGRLVFAMVARHFMPDQSTIEWLQKDSDFSAEAATSLLRQVEGRDYNPPKRERILEWQTEQDFPILPNPSDPDCGNLYRNLNFPDGVYKHIEHYQEEKISAAE